MQDVCDLPIRNVLFDRKPMLYPIELWVLGHFALSGLKRMGRKAKIRETVNHKPLHSAIYANSIAVSGLITQTALTTK